MQTPESTDHRTGDRVETKTSTVLARLASALGRRDDVPNQELARDLAASRDTDAIAELVANLSHPKQQIRSDCIKVLYEVGYVAHDLIAPHAGTFIELLESRNNRMVWGAMSALAAVAPLEATALFARREAIQSAIDRGSVITADRGIKALSAVAAAKDTYREALWPYLLEHLRHCRPKDVPQRAEALLEAVGSGCKEDFVAVIRARVGGMRPSQERRLRSVIVAAEKR